MKKLLIITLLSVGSIINSCVQPLEIDNNMELNLLVVEGYITTGEGPFTITLSRSAKYGDIFDGYLRPVENAKVAVRDNLGKFTFFAEIDNGQYQSPIGFRAEVGKTYSLQIIANGAKTYYSLPETVTAAPPIDSLFIRYKKLISDDPLKFKSGVEVYSVWQDPEAEKNYHLWLNNGTYKLITYPEDYSYVDGNGNRVPFPLDCCKTCFADQIADFEIHTYSDLNSNGNTVTNLAAFVEDDGLRFSEKYLVRIEQLAISQDAYLFFNLVNNQLSITGDIFDPPPATIRGNILNIDDPEEVVLGYFFAADVAIDSIFIHRDFLNDQQVEVHINNSCLTVSRTTTEEPSYWNEN